MRGGYSLPQEREKKESKSPFLMQAEKTPLEESASTPGDEETVKGSGQATEISQSSEEKHCDSDTLAKPFEGPREIGNDEELPKEMEREKGDRSYRENRDSGFVSGELASKAFSWSVGDEREMGCFIDYLPFCRKEETLRRFSRTRDRGLDIRKRLQAAVAEESEAWEPHFDHPRGRSTYP